LQKKGKIEKYLNTAWTVSIIRGILISLLIMLASGPVATFFGSSQAKNLLMLIAVIPVIRGFINPSIIKFQKNLEFDREFAVKSTLTILETVLMVIFCWWLVSPVGLVLAMIVTAVCEVAISFIFIRPWPKFGFKVSQIWEIVSSGKWVTGFGILDYIFTQGDNIVVGRLLGTASLGIYRLSYTMSTLPLTEISDVFYKVAFPTLSKMISEKKNVKEAMLKIVSTICILATLAGFVIWWAAPYIVLLLGTKWTSTIGVIKVLAFLGILRSISFAFNSVFMAYGKQKYVTVILLTSVAGLLATIVPLVNIFGLVGAGYSTIIGAGLSVPVAIILFSKVLHGLR
jgi:O-antigen/teichoic acid export membrane protein